MTIAIAIKDVTEKHWQQQLPPIKYKQTIRDTVAQYPRRRKYINFLTSSRSYKNVLITSDFIYTFFNLNYGFADYAP